MLSTKGHLNKIYDFGLDIPPDCTPLLLTETSADYFIHRISSILLFSEENCRASAGHTYLRGHSGSSTTSLIITIYNH